MGSCLKVRLKLVVRARWRKQRMRDANADSRKLRRRKQRSERNSSRASNSFYSRKRPRRNWSRSRKQLRIPSLRKHKSLLSKQNKRDKRNRSKSRRRSWSRSRMCKVQSKFKRNQRLVSHPMWLKLRIYLQTSVIWCSSSWRRTIQEWNRYSIQMDQHSEL